MRLMTSVLTIFVLCAVPVMLAAQAALPGSQAAQPLVEISLPNPTLSSASDTAHSPSSSEHSLNPDVADRHRPRPRARPPVLPRTRWEHRARHVLWSRAALSALKTHGRPLVDLVPADIATWCPAYPQATDAGRRAFWVGFLSALAKYESNYKPHVVGGDGKWHGLLQILPGTARGYKCHARTGKALRDGGANLSCAIRIMAVTVPRDGVIHGYKNKKGQGVTADWGPMHSKPKRHEMAAWLREQSYCKPVASKRPKLRP